MEPFDWEVVRERIIELEGEATLHTNAARDALMEQGDLFNQVAPRSENHARTGAMAELERMAAECGISVNTARKRRDVSSLMPPGGRLRTMLQDNSDVLVSYASLQTVMGDDQPEVLLERLLREAREEERPRITRDEVRRVRGMVPGTVGDPASTGERMLRDPMFMQQIIDSIPTVHIEHMAKEWVEQAHHRVLDRTGADRHRGSAGDPRPRWIVHVNAAVSHLASALEEAVAARQRGDVALATEIREEVSARIAQVMSETVGEITVPS
jgi:hypothetical protein